MGNPNEVPVIDVYTDGSYSSASSIRTTGAALVLYRDSPLLSQRYVIKTPSLVSMRNVGGELVAASRGVFLGAGVLQAILAENDGVVPTPAEMVGVVRLNHDYIGISELVSSYKPWKAEKCGSIAYVNAIRMFKQTYPKVHLKFRKVKAHSGVKWNEVVDAVACDIIPIEVATVMMPEVLIE